MATALGFYHDDALTTQVTTLNKATFQQFVGGAGGPDTLEVFLGSPTSGITFKNTTDPDVAELQVSIVNSGTGEPASAVKLALTEGGLASAVAGDPLDIGVSLDSGVANALSIWIQVDDSTDTLGAYTNLTLKVINVEDFT
jgi:hypothetical protein